MFCLFFGTLRSSPYPQSKEAMPHFPNRICYSEKYYDNEFEYRHVILTKDKS